LDMTAIIKGSGILKRYGSLEVLKGIDITINKGEVVSIVGASGAGKTTLLTILGTLDLPDQGQLEINNQNIMQLDSGKLSAFRNEHIGFVFQFHHLLPEFTALENVCMPALIKGTPKKEAEQRAQQLLDRLGLSDRMQHKPSELSGGEQQRVAVARALMNEPAVVFADEPSGNLDSSTAKELHELFFALRDEMQQTFVIVTHNEQLANMADRKLVMKDGLIVTT
jgi:lipoprotein-releasing system ATP-binding protein